MVLHLKTLIVDIVSLPAMIALYVIMEGLAVSGNTSLVAFNC